MKRRSLELADTVKEHVRQEIAALERRLRDVETENIVLQTELRLIKELTLNCSDVPARPAKSLPLGRPIPGISRNAAH